jgi:hypothetical protein
MLTISVQQAEKEAPLLDKNIGYVYADPIPEKKKYYLNSALEDLKTVDEDPSFRKTKEKNDAVKPSEQSLPTPQATLSEFLLLSVVFFFSSWLISALICAYSNNYFDWIKESDAEILVPYTAFLASVVISLMAYGDVSPHIRASIVKYNAICVLLFGTFLLAGTVYVGVIIENFKSLAELVVLRMLFLYFLWAVCKIISNKTVAYGVSVIFALIEGVNLMGFVLADLKFWLMMSILIIANGVFIAITKVRELFSKDKIDQTELAGYFIGLMTVCNGISIRFLIEIGNKINYKMQ